MDFRKHHPQRRLPRRLRSQAAAGAERGFIQTLEPSLPQPGREGLVPMGCSTLAPGPFAPGGFLIKFPGWSSKKTRNLCKVDGAVLV